MVSHATAIAAKTLTFAHSPDPDDAFMFYGFASGAVAIPGYEVTHHLQDIETLNAQALKGTYGNRYCCPYCARDLCRIDSALFNSARSQGDSFFT